MKIDQKNLNKAERNSFVTTVQAAPKNYTNTSSIYKKYKGKKKIIGICLGFQQILYCEKGKIVEQKKYLPRISICKLKVTSNNSLFKKNCRV